MDFTTILFFLICNLEVLNISIFCGINAAAMLRQPYNPAFGCRAVTPWQPYLRDVFVLVADSFSSVANCVSQLGKIVLPSAGTQMLTMNRLVFNTL